VTEAEKIAALVHRRLEQADEALAAAELNLANGLQLRRHRQSCLASSIMGL
jgi:hypothetical protein